MIRLRMHFVMFESFGKNIHLKLSFFFLEKRRRRKLLPRL